MTAPLRVPGARRWRLGGRVQGVGFRPYVYRLAQHFGVSGWVRSDGRELEIHAQGPRERLREFGLALLVQVPPAARARLLATGPAPQESSQGFRILASRSGTEAIVHLPLDLGTCADCLAELRAPESRRHRYPFINCTQCGPRYTLIRALPYDRANTTVGHFPLCASCAAEFADPLDRRFHAQPLACAVCGPTLEWSSDGERRSGNEPALAAARAALSAGRIVALRGVGGYQLLCDAGDEVAVRRLRTWNGRSDYPSAVMMPWCGADGLDAVRRYASLSALEAACLLGVERPIVILASDGRGPLASSIALALRERAILLPHSPLQHLLLADFGGPLAAASGHLYGEPAIIEPNDAEARLANVADGFLHHDRPLARHAADPVCRVIRGRARPLRLGRGTAPLELELAQAVAVPTLALGGFSAATVALAWGRHAVISPHTGELSGPRSRAVVAELALDLQRLYGVAAECIAHDAHPGSPGARYALASGLSTHAVWHHAAQASALAGEFAQALPGTAPLLCFTWDAGGLGLDGTLWGGEALLGRPGAWQRVASLRRFRLPGGARAAREPWRAALGACADGGCPWPEGEARGGALLRSALRGGLNAPWTTSVGRLFDAAAALIGLGPRTSYEGETAVRLEALCGDVAEQPALLLPLERDANGLWRTDWAPLLPRLLDSRVSAAHRAGLFHASLARALFDQALAVHADTGIECVGLTGGVFRNRVLCEQAATMLTQAGFEVLIPARLPVNDAAISFGQLIESAARA
jgi:hydrogenase maturation protein HypF